MIVEYEDYLIGRRRTACFCNTDTGRPNEQHALELIQYVIEKLLCWTPEAAVKKFDAYMVQKLKLTPFANAISYPPDVARGDTGYILSRLYPSLVSLDQCALAEKMLVSVLMRKQQFPREYFNGIQGFYRYCVCLRYVLVNYKDLHTAEEAYAFCCSPEGRKFLAKNRLKSPAAQVGISVIDAVYEVTKDLPCSSLYHSYYHFKEELKRSQAKAAKKNVDS